jgi:uncharacterized membrane protein YbhN (UPF0104 family)
VGGLVVALLGLARAVDGDDLAAAGEAMISNPLALGLAVGAFAGAFVVRAFLWTRLLPELSLRHAVAGVHLATGANHVLPFRLGEPLRVVSVARRGGTPARVATSSTVALRAADIVAVAVLGWLVAPSAFGRVIGSWGWVVFGVVTLVGVGGFLWLRHDTDRVRLPALTIAAGSMVAWALEAVLVWQCAQFAGIDLTPQHAVLVTAAAVSAQVVAITPGGIGTYEAASVAAYTTLGYDAALALVAAVATHAVKTIYTIAVGAVALVVPAPGLAGHLRLPRERTPVAPPVPAPDDGPVVLFLPAHDEEETVAEVVRRAPAHIGTHPVEVVVIDDGSTDRTAERARAADADVLTSSTNRGLGAAVRTGLHDACERGAVAVAFCDADGEYDPAELARLIDPVLDGSADYVVGSRFTGTIESMRPHRRFGNIVLTRTLRWIARTPISDGQSGYRALSARAARAAEIVHDYNYAQVLTLDLIGKGFTYVEVPITYRFRSTGRSFVKLGRYLARVVPAVHREINARATAATTSNDPSVLDDVPGEAVASQRPTAGVEPAVRTQRVGRGRSHGEHVVGVVLDEQPLPAEHEQTVLR